MDVFGAGADRVILRDFSPMTKPISADAVAAQADRVAQRHIRNTEQAVVAPAPLGDKAHDDASLDNALKSTFPASDPSSTSPGSD